MIWACILGYLAIGTSFYLYITKTAQIDPYENEDNGSGSLNQSTTLRMVAGGTKDGKDRKAA